MSSFTTEEIAYLRGQRLGRLATVNAAGEPHVTPVGFRYNAENDTIEIGGHGIAATRKYRDAGRGGMVAFVVDDVPPPPPWRPRGIEIRGRAQALSSGGKAIMAEFDDEMIRIAPSRIISWGIEAGGTRRFARDVRDAG
jgi:pyridoxamine 5'-phosphate oxidase family protein